jgi:hypothetical protein
LFGAVLAVVLLACQPAPPRAAERPDLDGVWTLNEELSEDPREKMHEAMRSGRGKGGGRGGPGGGMGRGGGGGGGGRGGMGDPEQMRRRMEDRERAARRLEIRGADPGIVIRYADGSERTLFPDGKRHRRETGVGDLETTARWKSDGRLVVKARTERGQEIEETYEIEPYAHRLHVTVESAGGRGPKFSFLRVYDFVDPGNDAPAEPDPDAGTEAAPS